MSGVDPFAGAARLAEALAAGTVSSLSVTELYLSRITALDPLLRAYVTVLPDPARAEAAASDRRRAAGVARGPLDGVPYAVKDIYDTAGTRTTCNSRLMADRVPARDAEVVRRLREAGAVLLGKLNTHEFAFGGPGFDLPVPPARNPWNPEHFTGGSSSGCGVAVAAGLAAFAMGSDTGGSIRSPAAHCGVAGLKPTYGLISRRGLFPLSYSLDHAGPLARTVADIAMILQVVAGPDREDPASVAGPDTTYADALGAGLAGLRIGYARGFVVDSGLAHPEVIAVTDDVAARCARLGATVETVDLPDFDLFKACARVIMGAEAYAIHEADLQARPRAYGRYMYQRTAAGAILTGSDYVRAQQVRRHLVRQLNGTVLDRYDLILCNTNVTPAARLDAFPLDWPPPAAAVAVQTAPFNVTGNPALTLPAGFSRDGLPLGVQLAGRAFGEATVLRAAAALESDLQLLARRPDLPVPALPDRSRSAPDLQTAGARA